MTTYTEHDNRTSLMPEQEAYLLARIDALRSYIRRLEQELADSKNVARLLMERLEREK